MAARFARALSLSLSIYIYIYIYVSETRNLSRDGSGTRASGAGGVLRPASENDVKAGVLAWHAGPAPSSLLLLLLSRLELSDTHVYEPSIRALHGIASHFCEVVVLKLAPSQVAEAGAWWQWGSTSLGAAARSLPHGTPSQVRIWQTSAIILPNLLILYFRVLFTY